MAVLSVKDFPDELMILLKVKAAQEQVPLRKIVIAELGKVLNGSETGPKKKAK